MPENEMMNNLPEAGMAVPAPAPAPASTPMSASTTAPICPVCHAPVQPDFYFCPNCGNSLKQAPLSTSGISQAWIYALSLALPWIAFLAVSHWPGVRYARSDDPQAKQIGMIAIALLAVSTIITFWLAIVWTQAVVQDSLNSIGNLGGL